jgi:hypothetical protein
MIKDVCFNDHRSLYSGVGISVSGRNRRIGWDKPSRVPQIEQGVNGMQRAQQTEHSTAEEEQESDHSNPWHVLMPGAAQLTLLWCSCVRTVRAVI